MEIGDPVPDFSAPTDDGGTFRLSEALADGPVVLFFYPKARTAGCTAEACHFRDLADEFAAVGAGRYGVSRDDVERQASFRDEHGFDFPLLADEDGAIGRLFGAKRLGPLWHRRLTVVIDEDQRLLGVVKSESDMERHADDALALLNDRAGAREDSAG